MAVLRFQYCSDQIWNTDIFWHAHQPRVTKCFQNTAVVFSTGFFWLSLIPWIFWIGPKPPRESRRTLSWNLIFKVLITIGLIVLFGVDLYDRYTGSVSFYGSDVLYYTLNLITLTTSLLLFVIEWKKAIHSSLLFT